MSAAAILTILGIVSDLATLTKEAPDLATEARSLLAKIAPHLDAVGETAREQFKELQEKLA